MYQGMHSSENSTTSSNWVLRECFKLVHLGDEMPMASRASWRQIQIAQHQRYGERCGRMAWIHEDILGAILQEILHCCSSYMVQWPAVQRYGMEPQKKERIHCWVVWALWSNGLCDFMKWWALFYVVPKPWVSSYLRSCVDAFGIFGFTITAEFLCFSCLFIRKNSCCV